MREPPPLPTPALLAALLAALRAGYGLAATTVTFLPLGYDDAASVYRVTAADGRAYFLKLRSDAVNPAGLAVPHYLHAQGLPEVLAPLPTQTGALWHPLDTYALILYPFLHAAVPLPSGQADAHWRRLGALLRRVHETPLPPDLQPLLPRETFTPLANDLAQSLDARVHRQSFDEPLQQQVAAFWREHAAVIRAVTAQAERLGARLRQAAPRPLHVCHADPHWSNVLVDAQDQLWLVDWDDTVLAIKERDLMFVIGGLTDDWGTPRDTARFFEGYGPAEVDPLALAYYRADWAVQDLAAFAEQVLLQPALGEATRRDAARLFMGLFGPGQIVEKALGSGV